MKHSFFQEAVISILLYGCTTWTLTKLLKKKLDGNYTRMLRAILNKSWWQNPTRHQLYGYLPPITKTIQVRRTRHAGHCWRNRDELIRDVLLWTPTYGRAKAGRPALTYIRQLCEDKGCGPKDLPEAMNDWEKWRGISVPTAWHAGDDDIYIYIYVCMYVCMYSIYNISSSWYPPSTDIPDLLSPTFSVVNFFRHVLRTTSCIGTELLYVGSGWSSCLCSSLWNVPQEYITYEFVLLL